MTITNKNSAYIILRSASKVNNKVFDASWRWGSSVNFAELFENGEDYETRTRVLETLNGSFCTTLTLVSGRENCTRMQSNYNVRTENYDIIEEIEIDFEALSDLFLPDVQILLFNKSAHPEVFSKINAGYSRNRTNIEDTMKYLIAIKPKMKIKNATYSIISSKAWNFFIEKHEGLVTIPQTRKSYVDFTNAFSPLTRGRSPISSTSYISGSVGSGLGDLVLLDDTEESNSIKTKIQEQEKVSAIKFKSILKGSKSSSPNFITSLENHASGYTLLPYESLTSNLYWCKTSKSFEQMKVRGFISTINELTIIKYKKVRQTFNLLINDISKFNGEAIFDPEKFEQLRKEMAKGHDTYSNHILEIFPNSDFSTSVKYSDYSKQNISKINLSSLSSLNNSKKYRDLKAITQTVKEVDSKAENLSREIADHSSKVSRTKRSITDQKEQIERYSTYIETCKQTISNQEGFLLESDEKLKLKQKQLNETNKIIEMLNPQKELVLNDYKKSLDLISFEGTKDDKFLKTLNSQGVYIINILYKNKNDHTTISVKDNASVMFNVKKQSLIQSNEYALDQIEFKLTKPTIVRVDPIEKGENCPKVAIGPLYVKLNSNNIHLSPLTSNCILGVNKQKNTFWLHPHTASFNLSSSNLESFISSLMRISVRACLGEASSAIYNAFQNQDPRQAIFAAMTWLTSANSTDAWGKYWKNFPRVAEVNSMQKEISEEDYQKELFKSSISDSELILQNFFDNVSGDSFQEIEMDWTEFENDLAVQSQTTSTETHEETSSTDAENWEELVENRQNELLNNQQNNLRTAGVQGYVPLHNTNNTN